MKSVGGKAAALAVSNGALGSSATCERRGTRGRANLSSSLSADASQQGLHCRGAPLSSAAFTSRQCHR